MALKPTLPKLYIVVVDFADCDDAELQYAPCYDKDGFTIFITSDWNKANQHVEYLKVKTNCDRYFVCELTHAPVRNQNRNNG